MAKITIVFHSICGNTYQMADCFYKALKERGQEAAFFRTPDVLLESGEKKIEACRSYQDAILSVPAIQNAAQALDSDLLLLGSPTYYGCVSAQMKAFMDSFEKHWVEAPMAGTYFGCFTSAGDACGGAELCLQAMNTFAQHMAMLPIPVPCNLPGAPQPAYGIKHVSGALADRKLAEETKKSINSYVDHILSIVLSSKN